MHLVMSFQILLKQSASLHGTSISHGFLILRKQGEIGHAINFLAILQLKTMQIKWRVLTYLQYEQKFLASILRSWCAVTA